MAAKCQDHLITATVDINLSLILKVRSGSCYAFTHNSSAKCQINHQCHCRSSYQGWKSHAGRAIDHRNVRKLACVFNSRVAVQ